MKAKVATPNLQRVNRTRRRSNSVCHSLFSSNPTYFRPCFARSGVARLEFERFSSWTIAESILSTSSRSFFALPRIVSMKLITAKQVPLSFTVPPFHAVAAVQRRPI